MRLGELHSYASTFQSKLGKGTLGICRSVYVGRFPREGTGGILDETTFLTLTCAGLEPDLADFTRFVCRGRSASPSQGERLIMRHFATEPCAAAMETVSLLRSPQTTMEIGMRFRSLNARTTALYQGRRPGPTSRRLLRNQSKGDNTVVVGWYVTN